MRTNSGGKARRAAWLGSTLLMLCGPGDGVAGSGVGARERPVRRTAPAVRPAGQAAATGSPVAGGAQARLEQAYARELSPGLLCQLGLVAAEAGQELAAQDLLRRCRRDARPGSLSEELVRRSDAVLAQKRAPSGELSVLGPRRALLSVDGRLLGALPLAQPLLLAPGPHEVRLRLGGRELRGAVTVTAGRGALLRFVQAVVQFPVVGPGRQWVACLLQRLAGGGQQRALAGVGDGPRGQAGVGVGAVGVGRVGVHLGGDAAAASGGRLVVIRPVVLFAISEILPPLPLNVSRSPLARRGRVPAQKHPAVRPASRHNPPPARSP